MNYELMKLDKKVDKVGDNMGDEMMNNNKKIMNTNSAFLGGMLQLCEKWGLSLYSIAESFF